MKNVYLFSIYVCVVAQLCLALRGPMDYSLPGSSVPGDSSGKNSEWVGMPSSRGSSQPGTESRSPTSQVDSLLFEPPVKLYSPITKPLH